MDEITDKILERTSIAQAELNQKAKVWKDKISQKPWAQKLASKMKRKSKTEAPAEEANNDNPMLEGNDNPMTGGEPANPVEEDKKE